MHNCFRQENGLSLIELMIAIAIVGILAAVAHPMYHDSIMKTQRSEATIALVNLQNRMEQYFADRNSYANAHIGGTADRNQIISSDLTENNLYKLEISNITATTYTIRAIPQGRQATSDSTCATFALQSDGTKSVTGSGDVQNCW